MITCFFVSDLHGHIDRYEKLFKKIEKEKPSVVFFGGDLLPSGLFSFTSNSNEIDNFTTEVLIQGLQNLKRNLSKEYPSIFIILGNDDGRSEESVIIEAELQGIWNYVHNKKVQFREFAIYGYSYVPPTPFLLKDWERYDVSRYVDPGCVPPEEGTFSFDEKKDDVSYSTIQKDLNLLTKEEDLSKSIFLFHTPPYQTKLDRAALDGKKIDHVPLDVHVGSIAVKRFIEEKQPHITLHGHVHESTKITGSWKDQIGNTYMFNAAHNGPELSLVKFNLEEPENAKREII